MPRSRSKDTTTNMEAAAATAHVGVYSNVLSASAAMTTLCKRCSQCPEQAATPLQAGRRRNCKKERVGARRVCPRPAS